MKLFIQVFCASLVLVSSSNAEEFCEGAGEGQWKFQTCVWGANECKYSCPNMAFRVEHRPNDVCEYQTSEWACYCWVKEVNSD